MIVDYTEVIEGYERIFWEMWAAFNAFRVMGFRADDIYASWAKGGDPHSPTFGKPHAFTVLRAQAKEFTLTVGPVHLDKEAFNTRWIEFATKVAAEKFPCAVMQNAWESSKVFAMKVQFITAVMNKGFKVPRHNQHLNRHLS